MRGDEEGGERGGETEEVEVGGGGGKNGEGRGADDKAVKQVEHEEEEEGGSSGEGRPLLARWLAGHVLSPQLVPSHPAAPKDILAGAPLTITPKCVAHGPLLDDHWLA